MWPRGRRPGPGQGRGRDTYLALQDRSCRHPAPPRPAIGGQEAQGPESHWSEACKPRCRVRPLPVAVQPGLARASALVLRAQGVTLRGPQGRGLTAVLGPQVWALDEPFLHMSSHGLGRLSPPSVLVKPNSAISTPTRTC